MQFTVTGATGFLGANLAILLSQKGHRVHCVKRPGGKVDHLKEFDFHWFDAELSDVPALTAAFTNSNAVFHCAAGVVVKPRSDQELYLPNVIGTQNVIQAVKASGSPILIHCSTVDTIGLNQDGTPADETVVWNYEQLGIAHGYARTKLQAEQCVLKAVDEGLLAVIVNPGFMLGPYDIKPSSGRLILEVLKRKLLGYSQGSNTFVSVDDVAQGMLMAYEKGAVGERYILGGYNLTYQEIIHKIKEVAGVEGRAVKVPYLLARSAGYVGDFCSIFLNKNIAINSITAKFGYVHHVYSSEKAKKALGYQLTPLELAIQKAINWFQQEKYFNF